ncbi:uncharacterized protein [Dermacentor andersoni]|uniref:uncharacterized protein isoform X2 n=1 Tax=Dermacentor andersoni TaxID=34620 RepID=UPI003B3B0024
MRLRQPDAILSDARPLRRPASVATLQNGDEDSVEEPAVPQLSWPSSTLPGSKLQGNGNGHYPFAVEISRVLLGHDLKANAVIGLCPLSPVVIATRSQGLCTVLYWTPKRHLSCIFYKWLFLGGGQCVFQTVSRQSTRMTTMLRRSHACRLERPLSIRCGRERRALKMCHCLLTVHRQRSTFRIRQGNWSRTVPLCPRQSLLHSSEPSSCHQKTVHQMKQSYSLSCGSCSMHWLRTHRYFSAVTIGSIGQAGWCGEEVTLVTCQDWKRAYELINILEDTNQEGPHRLFTMK